MCPSARPAESDLVVFDKSCAAGAGPTMGKKWDPSKAESFYVEVKKQLSFGRSEILISTLNAARSVR